MDISRENAEDSSQSRRTQSGNNSRYVSPDSSRPTPSNSRPGTSNNSTPVTPTQRPSNRGYNDQGREWRRPSPRDNSRQRMPSEHSSNSYRCRLGDVGDSYGSRSHSSGERSYSHHRNDFHQGPSNSYQEQPRYANDGRGRQWNGPQPEERPYQGHHRRPLSGHNRLESRPQHSRTSNGSDIDRNAHSHRHTNANSRSRALSPNVSAVSSSNSTNGSPRSSGNSASSSFREKRGRDRSHDDSGLRRKFQKNDSETKVAKGRKKREEFVDEIVTRPEGFVKQASHVKDVPVNLVANYFKVDAPAISVTGYHVDFVPETEVSAVRKRLIFQNKARLGGYVYDGVSQLFLLRPLNQQRVELQGDTQEGEEFKIVLRETERLNYTKARFLHVLNLVLRNGMRGLNLQQVGRNLFDAKPSVIIDIPQYRIQMWPGYDTSIRQHENGLLLNCDILYKVMRQENVRTIINDCYNRNGGANYQRAVGAIIIGATVLTDYNNQTYKINDIDWDQRPTDTFETKNGQVSYADYYRSRYNLKINDSNQPLLVSKASVRDIRAGRPEFILLIPELCRMTGLTDSDRRNTNLTRAMAERTRLNPSERVSKLERFSGTMNSTQECSNVFGESRMQIERRLFSFKAHRFAYEKLQFNANGNGKTLNERADWTRDFQNSMFKNVLDVELKNWFFVYPGRCERGAKDFMRSFMQAATGFLKGKPLVAPITVQLNDDRISTYEREVNQIMRQDPSFLMVVIPNKRDEVYRVLKKMTIGQSDSKPVAIQVVKENTCWNKNLLSIATKVAIQVNCKLGGMPWNVDLKLNGIMIVGFDISIGKGRKGETYGAMVASLNPQNNGGHYFSMAKQHRDGTMLSNNFGIMIQASLMRYRECNEGALPDQILIYRDGVGEGDLEFVNDQEVQNIQRTISNTYLNKKKPKLAFVIVNKKSNTRIMQKGRDGSRDARYINPLPGTIIDDGITLPGRVDFYLISQSVNQGTVAPVYYNVLQIGKSDSIRDLQLTTYKLCHNYFNWTGTVRVPSVIQYAKKLAMLSQDTLNGIPSDQFSLKQQLYFL